MNITLIFGKRNLKVWSYTTFEPFFKETLESINSNTYQIIQEENQTTIFTNEIRTFQEIYASIVWNSPRYYKNFYETTDRNGDIIYKLFENNEEI